VIQVWNLRLIRQELAAMGLDWDLPSYPPEAANAPAEPVSIKVVLGDLAPAHSPDSAREGLMMPPAKD
jgi:hypothetical protein